MHSKCISLNHATITGDFLFFSQLEQNNHREWFEAHKPEFKALETSVKQFGEALKYKLNTLDSIDRFKLFRIYRDVRFSKDKTPYKTRTPWGLLPAP